MASSLFEQYNEATARSGTPFTSGLQQPSTRSAPISSGYVTASIEEDVKIFTRQKINFTPPRAITHMVANNNMLMIAMADRTILRINRDQPDQRSEVKLSDEKIHKMFLDPSGQHLIISTETLDVLYVGKKSRKAKHLAKMKGHLIESVGWNKMNRNETTTTEILLGTSRGCIFETLIQAGDDGRFFQQNPDQYWKMVYNLGKESTVPVTGLHVERISGSTQSDKRTIFIMATTPERMYQFIGTIMSTEAPIFLQVFQRYENTIPTGFLELPGNIGYSQLQVYTPKQKSTPQGFAWMSGQMTHIRTQSCIYGTARTDMVAPSVEMLKISFFGIMSINSFCPLHLSKRKRCPGVFIGNFDFQELTRENLTKDSHLLIYPLDKEGTVQIKPISMILTEFHVLLLYSDRVQVICTLNETPIDEDLYQVKFGKLLGMCRDATKGTIWTYSDQGVFMYKVTRESRDVWKIYLNKGDFNLALTFCQDNQAQRDEVLRKQAQHFFDEKQFDKSALYFASTEMSFEEVTLKFIEADQKEALRIFLQKKMANLPPEDKAQMTMLVIWLIELFLNQVGILRNQPASKEKYDSVHDGFRKFIAQKRVMECLKNNVDTVYDLIASHGDVTDMVFFAMLMKDYERVISHHIQGEDYQAALEVLKKTSKKELFYKFSPVLMQHIPKELVTAWIIQDHSLDPKKLIPALVQYKHNDATGQTHEGIRYLEFCVTKLKKEEQAIHNYLVSLYAQHAENQLMKYLLLEGEDATRVHYDLKYALRLCSEHQLKRACVHIYTTMELYEEAVDLALQVDVDLAKRCAEKPEEDDEGMKRKLWLQIAKHVVKEQSDIQKAMEILQECPLLKIEDVLPFFPDFVTIDHFKDAICSSLENYNQHIQNLQTDMDEASESAEAIRADIHNMRNNLEVFIADVHKMMDKVRRRDRSTQMRQMRSPLLSRAFYLYPCGHKFHADCLIKEVTIHLSPTQRIHLSELEHQISSLKVSNSKRPQMPRKGDDLTPNREEMERLQTQIDDIVAAECVYCGDVMIRSIDKPFIEQDELEARNKSWE
ncbi:putative vacuolar protein sorting-associated protein 18-like [Apostichopus japonicus]|uniref:Vacuolar protein sorting-associated protein 18 homolog n=1 Tax=Stichopus japonicus TaxID=307972 RepID=A0A2G8LM25_STIJA|nr:putative vacuolar protein sorting-associated protein 18-like [Apostichopus japonicus]